MCACWGGFFIVKVTTGRWPSHLECVCVVERDREQLEGERERENAFGVIFSLAGTGEASCF